MRRRIEYAELHLHTAYSFLDGASLPEELVGRAVDLGYRWLAVTDHDGLHGAIEFAQAARTAGIAPITGAEITLSDGAHLTLLVETRAGYANLCRLLTAAHRATGDRHRQPWLDPALLSEHAEGLILLTGCRRGPLARLVDTGRLPEAETLLRDYMTWFGSRNVAVELQHNLVHGDTARIARLVEIAERLGLRYVATGNVHYHQRERHRLQDLLVAIRHRASLDACHRERRPNAEFFLRSAEEMAFLFRRHPQALATAVRIAERCADFDLTTDLTYHFPGYETGTDETPDDHLTRICWEAAGERYRDNWEAAKARLSEELTLIHRHQLAGFFLLYRDLLALAREVATEIRAEAGRPAAHLLPPGRGRGSSVSSIVCYLIGLSSVDPLAHGLLLGRFLNEELSAVPDIDLDFPREIREKLIERVYERYPNRAGLVCAFATYRLRSAVRDVGKALGLPVADLDRIAKLSEPRSATDLGAELARLPEYATRLALPPWSHLVELAGALAGFPRHVTQHVGGMVITSRPIAELVPVQPAAMPGRWLVQWDKDSCDDARFVKIDFLALGMLSLIEECVELVAVRRGPVDLSQIDFNDRNVYDMICAGDTIGTFQVESRAQIQSLLRTQPRSLEDLVIQVAIIRPGPILGGAMPSYVAGREAQRRDPRWQPAYDHPCLAPILAETFGAVLYQEQVIQVAMELAGFTAGQADQLRRAMTRKRSHEAMVRLWGQFRTGALKRDDVDSVTARAVFDKLRGFASYGFPKAHAAAFALLAYQSCWLKRYYPAEFICALLNNQPMGFYPPHMLVNDAKRHHIRVLPPDINASDIRCTLEEGETVRIGLGYVKGLGEAAARRVVEERERHGPYTSLADFVRRLPLRMEAAEALIGVGAFDSFGLRRREALWQLGLFATPHPFGSAQPGRNLGTQWPLPLPVAQDMVTLPRTTAWERMQADYETLGLSPRYHPLGLLRPDLPRGIVTTAELAHLTDGSRVEVAGLVVCRQRPGTAKGITFLLLEDECGWVNVIIYPDLYHQQRPLVRGEPFLIVAGRLQRRDRNLNVLAQRLRRIERVPGITALPVGHSPRGDEPPVSRWRGAGRRPLMPASHDYR